ncbi:taurine transport system substrate-binding protein [Monaibacterium marinum]|uniref:Taurine transport system substrate-binding protein n=1 Tax=Pontivivens marinum TaxID=1690039 RepID=A0A2C9CUZ1_9RHOB|nr:ABC transporter substrate-binding protein [Monaibacterium marinum]SOH95176.1 taurine transport system substrate-binding protein [Monaibacterium marinum]
MSITKKFAGGMTAIALIASAHAATAQEITVGYFLEWPMPFQFAKANGIYEEEMGVTINWRSFDAGTAMSAAMASGDVHISVSQGVPPFVIAASAGQDLVAVDVAVAYADNDNCVVAEALEIDASTASDLAGLTAAVPIGTAAHYGFLKQMEHFGVDVSTMNIVDMAPAEGAVALSQGDVDMSCGWGGGLRRMLEHGNILLTGAEKQALGIQVFDVTSVPADFAAEQPEMLAEFLAVTARMNAMWNSGEHTDEMLAVIAQDAGMDVDAAAASLATFAFPSVEEQLGEEWFGGATQTFLKEVADFFVEQGNIPSARDTYEDAVDTAPLSEAAE